MICPDLITGIICKAIKAQHAEQSPALQLFNFMAPLVVMAFMLLGVLLLAVYYALVLRSEIKFVAKEFKRGLPVILEMMEDVVEHDLEMGGDKQDSEADLVENETLL